MILHLRVAAQVLLHVVDVSCSVRCCLDWQKVANGAEIERLLFAHSTTVYRPLGHLAAIDLTPATI